MSRQTYVGSRVEDVDVQMERITRLVDTAATIDRELAAGLATSTSMTGVQRSIDVALASAEELAKDIRKQIRK